MPYSFSCEAEGPRRNGAQLLELGKEDPSAPYQQQTACRNGAQLLELGKVAAHERIPLPCLVAMEPSF